MANRTSTGRDSESLALNRKQAAMALGISVDSFERHVQPHVPVVCVGRLRLFPIGGLRSWLDQQTIDPAKLRGLERRPRRESW
ncbi:MAG: hypothetical protein ACR2K6_03630 [Solirubrobacterales bacterium]